MTTAVAGRARRRQGIGPTGWVAVACLTLLIVASAVAVHMSMPSWYARLWYPIDHVQVISAESRASGVQPDLLAAVIYQESKFSEDARSDRGAVGLMQVLPGTAQWIRGQPGAPAAGPARLAEPAVNIAYGAWYLRYLIDKYGSQDLALAAYNGGETNLRRWIADARREGHTLDPADIPFSETRGFVAAVRDAQSIYRRAWSESLQLP